MVEVKSLTKYYGSVCAVNGVSFSVAKGEIVGFLGPNGAGKTTTLRILANFFPQTSGSVSLAGKDARRHPLEVRQRVGYLAENNPLWLGMEVSEYLNFVWEARNLGSRAARAARLKEVVEQCGLRDMVGRDIGELSKGFRQRVGLAAAILHDPDILLLDEPTSGLDPIQAREVRSLIQGFKEKKTILFSTHILSEVQAICDRVIIIHKGQIVADEKTSELAATGEEYVISVHLAKRLAEGVGEIQGISGVQGVEGPLPVTDGEWAFKIRALADVRGEIFKYASRKEWPLLELRMERRSLEDVFHELTK